MNYAKNNGIILPSGCLRGVLEKFPMGEEEKLQKELDILVKEHKELDATIRDLLDSKTQDQLRVQRLKKRKLWLKDRITQLREYLTPDIIA